jgi:hypothetical protein
MSNHYLINFNKDIICKEFSQENYGVGRGWMTHKILKKEDILSNESINLLSLLSVPYFINLFYGPPGASTHIHVDQHLAGWAINYAWGSTDSIMRWYSIKDGCVPKSGMTTANTPYMFYEPNQVDVIEEKVVNGLCLVNTSIPHSVHNFDKINSRWCISIRTSAKHVTSDMVLEKLSL